jgi:hypothetical protein
VSCLLARLRPKLALRQLLGILILLTLPSLAFTQDVARMGFNVKIARDLNRSDVQAALGLWADELSKAYGVPTETEFYEDTASMRRDFDQGKINFVIAASMDFARYFKLNELADGFRGEVINDHTLLLLAHKEARIADVRALAGKRIALLAGDELSDVYLETVCLRHYQRPCKQVFSGIDMVANSNQLMMKLFFRKVDLVLSKLNGFETARELNPQIGLTTQEITRFPLKSSYYGLYSRKVSPEFRQRSLRQVPGMHKAVRGRQVLEVFKVDRLVLVSEQELQPVYDLLADYEALRASGGKSGSRR